MSGARERGAALRFDLSGIAVRLAGLSPELRARFAEEWAGFLGRGAAPPRLDVAVREVPGAGLSEHALASWSSRFDGSRARFRLPEGEVDVDADGRAELRVAPRPEREQFYAALNLLLPALAWVLPTGGGLLLHAAGVVLDGRAHVLVGSAGSGKSTWAGLAREAGAMFLSDDLVVVEVGGGGARALSLPFRHDRERPVGPGRWPLRGLLFPAHGETPRIDPLDRVTAAGRIWANLLYVAGALPAERRIARALDGLLDAAPPATLTFRPDDSFLALLRGSAPAGS